MGGTVLLRRTGAPLAYALLFAATAAVVVGLYRTAPNDNLLLALPAVLLTMLLGLAALRHRAGLAPVPDIRAVLACCALVLLLASIGPVQRSRDLWAYNMYGRIVTEHGGDPWADVASDYPEDPFVDRMNPLWQSTPAVYGPVFVGSTVAISKATGDNADAVRLAYKIAAGVCMGGVVLLLARRKVDPAAIAFVGLHPTITIYAVGGGHNDAWVGLAVLGAVLLAAKHRPVLAGLAVATGALIKLTSGLIGLPLVVWLWFRPDRSGRKPAILLATAAGATSAIAYLAVGLKALTPVRKAAGSTSWISFWRPVAEHLTGTSSAPTLTSIVGVCLLAGVLLVCWRHRHDIGPELSCAACLLLYHGGSSYELVWYMCWLLPVVVLRWRTPTMVLAAALSFAYLLPPTYEWAIRGVGVICVVGVLAVTLRRARPEGDPSPTAVEADAIPA